MQSKGTLTQSKIERINVKRLIEIQLFKLRYQIEKSDAQIKLSNLGYVHGNKRSFESLFSNLISNALKFQPQNKIHKPIIKISQTKKNNEFLIQVEDNGIGIKEEHLTDIFEPFKRLNYALAYDGTGLGLSICKTIIEKHNGRIEVESEFSKGTIFKVFVPQVVK